MQPPAFGGLLSCGGWIYDSVMELPLLQKVILIGPDEEAFSRVEPEIQKKVEFLSREKLRGMELMEILDFVKEQTGGMDIVYGGGLKQDNAAMLASIDEIDGGLIALTRFQGEIGYYPEEYLEIIRLYMGK